MFHRKRSPVKGRTRCHWDALLHCRWDSSWIYDRIISCKSRLLMAALSLRWLPQRNASAAITLFCPQARTWPQCIVRVSTKAHRTFWPSNPNLWLFSVFRDTWALRIPGITRQSCMIPRYSQSQDLTKWRLRIFLLWSALWRLSQIV